MPEVYDLVNQVRERHMVFKSEAEVKSALLSQMDKLHNSYMDRQFNSL